MNPASVDIKDMLESDSSLGLTYAENLFIAHEEPEPDAVVTVYDTPGGPEDLTLNTAHKLIYPHIQVRVRDIDYLDCWDTINDIKEFLSGKAGETWNGTLYVLVKAMSEPEILERDENGRFIFIINFKIHRR